MPSCEHQNLATPHLKPSSRTCRECAAAGQRPLHLRVCLICGKVGCCDSSPGRHATEHFQETGHAIMEAYPAEDWTWCYVHQIYMNRSAKKTSGLAKYHDAILGFVYSVKERLMGFVGRPNN